ncbi:phage tail assembly protein [Rhizobium halophytocola]|uniref:Phage tail assembly protein n=1 Tax=Rhizobium halophytocola TaxID=735519 RepID=A0ABS4E2D3_9HYPH|nr:phage tail assembly protein [Rhizobium halophytocola]MBP1852110.1 hypothetical protein [Rhizobium halophytocola]
MSVSVDLSFPVQFDGREIKTLSFRRMKAKDALIAEGEANQTRAGYLLFAALAGVDLKVIEELDIEDLETISEAIVPLMGKSAAKALSEEKLRATRSDGAT